MAERPTLTTTAGPPAGAGQPVLHSGDHTLSAIAGAWLEAHPVTIFGIGNVGPMLPQVHDLGQSIAYIHTILGNVIIWLASFHAAAALLHHFVLRDDTLISMLPDWKGSSALGSPAGEIPQ